MYISGIASGLDTETLIEQLMAIERRPLVLMQQRKNTLQQQRDAWRDINTRLNNLRDRMADLSRVSLFEQRAVSSSESDVATAAANRDAAEGTYRIRVIQLAQAHRVAGARIEDADGNALPKQPLGYTGTARLRVGDDGKWVDIAITGEDSLESIAAKINEAEVPASARVIDGRLVIEADETGSKKTLQFESVDVKNGAGVDVDLWKTLGILDEAGNVARTLQAAQDAVFEVEGLEITRSSNEIKDLIEGVTLRLAGEGETVLEIRRDEDAVLDAVKRFVEQYNSTMGFMRERMGEGGLLQGDSLLTRIQFQLRSDTMAAVGGPDMKYNQLAAIGISIDRDGHMSLDETRLREALAESPADVARLFTASTSDGDEFDGVAARLEDRFQQWLASGDGLLAARQKMFGDRMRAIEDSMERFEMRLEIRERNLRRQFIALEEALASLQTQSMWLAGQVQQLNAMSAASSQRRG